jgi:hypothetical protein
MVSIAGLVLEADEGLILCALMNWSNASHQMTNRVVVTDIDASRHLDDEAVERLHIAHAD